MSRITLTLLIVTFGINSHATETSHPAGKQLVQKHCISCHASSYGGDGSEIYKREYRKVRSLKGLEAQVRNCNTMLNLKWFDDEEQQVIQYLNQSYYHF